MISGLSYVHLLHPGTVDIPNETSQQELMRLTLAHAEDVRVFRDTVELEKVLINITCNAVQDIYYKEHIKPHTSTVTDRLSLFLP